MHLDQDEPELVLETDIESTRASHTLSAHGILIDGLITLSYMWRSVVNLCMVSQLRVISP